MVVLLFILFFCVSFYGGLCGVNWVYFVRHSGEIELGHKEYINRTDCILNQTCALQCVFVVGSLI
jgi:hypothetical protein